MSRAEFVDYELSSRVSYWRCKNESEIQLGFQDHFVFGDIENRKGDEQKGKKTGH
jgi:hypothetical protein